MSDNIIVKADAALVARSGLDGVELGNQDAIDAAQKGQGGYTSANYSKGKKDEDGINTTPSVQADLFVGYLGHDKDAVTKAVKLVKTATKERAALDGLEKKKGELEGEIGKLVAGIKKSQSDQTTLEDSLGDDKETNKGINLEINKAKLAISRDTLALETAQEDLKEVVKKLEGRYTVIRPLTTTELEDRPEDDTSTSAIDESKQTTEERAGVRPIGGDADATATEQVVTMGSGEKFAIKKLANGETLVTDSIVEGQKSKTEKAETLVAPAQEEAQKRSYDVGAALGYRQDSLLLNATDQNQGTATNDRMLNINGWRLKFLAHKYVGALSVGGGLFGGIERFSSPGNFDVGLAGDSFGKSGKQKSSFAFGPVLDLALNPIVYRSEKFNVFLTFGAEGSLGISLNQLIYGDDAQNMFSTDGSTDPVYQSGIITGPGVWEGVAKVGVGTTF